MTRSDALLKPSLIAAACGALMALSAAAQADDAHSYPLADAVHTVRLQGAGTALQVKTRAASDRQLDVIAEDNFGCTLSTRMRQQDDVLVVEVIAGGWRFGPWCDPDLIVTLPEGLALDIGLENLAADIRGVYGPVNITSQNSVIQFAGSASGFEVSGRRAALRLSFPPEMARDAVKIDVGLVMSDITFDGAAPGDL